MMSTSTVEYDSADNDTSATTLDINTTILQHIYNNLHGEPNYLLIVLYVPVMVVAVTANVLVIAVIFKSQYMRSVTNYFVVNLSIADLLVTTICMPMAVSQAISNDWTHGELMCKLSAYLQGVAVAASVYTITAMSIDRYLAIRNPIAFRRLFNRRSTVLIIVALWLFALIIFTPVLKVMTLQTPSIKLDTIVFRGLWPMAVNSSQKPPVFYNCKEDVKPLGIGAPLYGAVYFVLVYAIPGFVVVLSYSMMGRTLCSRKPPFDCDSVRGNASSQQNSRLVRGRRRIAWILLLLAVLFALCWLPYNVLMLLNDLDAVGELNATNDAYTYSLFLGHANSALNPVVYCFMTRNFRRSVVDVLCCGSDGLVLRRSRRRSVQGTAVIEDACAGCSTGRDGSIRGLLRKRIKMSGCGCGLPIGGDPGVLTVRRTATTSSGYDSFYTKHSIHKHCYMLRSLRGRPRISVEQVALADKPQGPCNERDAPAPSQPQT
ncbi:RYamide receptor-like [Lasioglossum baleicum]|uniref:RYamide receptor-like n=1 Tax=Lasioglossum baleicum TaxID=434251 RepID=UPI003FCD99DD